MTSVPYWQQDKSLLSLPPKV